MKKFIIYTFMSMILLAIILSVLIIILWSPNNTASFLGILISAALLAIDLITIISLVFIIFVFKINNMRQIIKSTVISVVSILIMIPIITFIMNPLMRPQEIIRERMLKLMSIGTSMEDVITVIASNRSWKVWNINSDGNWQPLTSDYKSYINVFTERKSIEILMGKYCIIFDTYVTVNLDFNQNLELSNITVRKDTDGL